MDLGKRLADLSIRAKTACAFACIVAVLLAANVLIHRKVSFIQYSSVWQTHTTAVMHEARASLAAMVDQETGMRGYLLSGNPDFLAPYTAGRAAFADHLARAKSLTADNPAQQTRLDRLGELSDTWHRDVADKENSLMGDTATQAEARRIEIAGTAKQSMDGIRAEVAEIVDAEQALLQVRADAANEAFSSTYMFLWVGGVLSVLAACLVGYALSHLIAGPVRAMTEAMRRLSQKDMAAEVPGLGRRDEIGGMAAAVQVFKASMVAGDRLAAEQEAERGTKEVRAQRLTGLVRNFEGQVGKLVGTLSAAAAELERTAQSMTSTAGQTNTQASTVATAASEASMGVQTVAAAAEELAASIAEITRQVTDSARMTVEAAQEARRTDGLVRTLSDGATRIGDVVALISGIAGQTNLLALNATIEAARAGDAGKGFAVVASEVKDLASQTAKATSDISTQIGQVQAAVQEAVAAIQGIVERVERISGISTSIASAVEQQGAATAEISRNVQRAASSTQQVTSTIAGVSEAAKHTGTTAGQVLGLAGGLSQQAAQLTSEVSGFVQGVRAA